MPLPDEDDSVRQPQRPLPPPEPPPLPSRRPKPGTGTTNIVQRQHAGCTAGNATQEQVSRTTSAILACAGKDKQESPRPPPPPEPPPPPPRRPWPGTSNMFAPANSSGTACGGSFRFEGPARIIQAASWHGPTQSTIKTTAGEWKERTPQKPPPPAEPPPVLPWQKQVRSRPRQFERGGKPLYLGHCDHKARRARGQ